MSTPSQALNIVDVERLYTVGEGVETVRKASKETVDRHAGNCYGQVKLGRAPTSMMKTQSRPQTAQLESQSVIV